MPASTEADTAEATETAQEASEEPELTDEQKSEALIKQLMAEEEPPQKSTYEELVQAQIEHER